ncbi:MAG: DUF1788 domain-containing protein [Desulfobacterales bacterium]|nr:DUF1788 domain-containing protein [Desulfobacteraceae bacterium]MDY0312854.1 DUF1788 domain-containing protein [Desulfobacterales bacterium]
MSTASIGLETAPMQERFEHLCRIITSERFLKMQGIGNEVPFYICPYPPEEAVEMTRMQKQLVNTVEKSGVRVLAINLYDLVIDLLKQRGIFERLLAVEASSGKEEFRDTLQGVLDPQSHLVPAIGERMQAAVFDVMFLTGVGQVFPYIRSHRVLNNLQVTAAAQPTVMFFPGVYTQSLEKGASLDLFGRLHDDKYYRAFNIYHCET